MKTFFLSLVIAAILVGGGLMFNVEIDNTASSLKLECEKISECIASGDNEGAKENVDKIFEYMNDKKMVLASIINHENIDEIELCISELSGYIDKGMEHEAYVRCKKLEHLLEHLPVNYKVNLQNIL